MTCSMQRKNTMQYNTLKYFTDSMLHFILHLSQVLPGGFKWNTYHNTKLSRFEFSYTWLDHFSLHQRLPCIPNMVYPRSIHCYLMVNINIAPKITMQIGSCHPKWYCILKIYHLTIILDHMWGGTSLPSLIAMHLKQGYPRNIHYYFMVNVNVAPKIAM